MAFDTAVVDAEFPEERSERGTERTVGPRSTRTQRDDETGAENIARLSAGPNLDKNCNLGSE